MNKIDHIGIAVRNLQASEVLFTAMLGTEPFHRETVESQHLSVSFFEVGPNKIELLCPTSDKSSVSRFLETRGEGIHHVAYAVDDILAETDRLKAAGFQPLSTEPFRGALNKLVIFFHPKTTGGVLTELCQKIPG